MGAETGELSYLQEQEIKKMRGMKSLSKLDQALLKVGLGDQVLWDIAKEMFEFELQKPLASHPHGDYMDEVFGTNTPRTVYVLRHLRKGDGSLVIVKRSLQKRDEKTHDIFVKGGYK